jgi:hypothetical protein
MKEIKKSTKRKQICFYAPYCWPIQTKTNLFLRALLLPQSQYDRLQRVLNAAARVVCLIPKFDPITPVLIGLHWLPVRYRVIFKILLLVCKALHANVPPYISDLLTLFASTKLWKQQKHRFRYPVSRTAAEGKQKKASRRKR